MTTQGNGKRGQKSRERATVLRRFVKEREGARECHLRTFIEGLERGHQSVQLRVADDCSRVRADLGNDLERTHEQRLCEGEVVALDELDRRRRTSWQYEDARAFPIREERLLDLRGREAELARRFLESLGPGAVDGQLEHGPPDSLRRDLRRYALLPSPALDAPHTEDCARAGAVESRDRYHGFADALVHGVRRPAGKGLRFVDQNTKPHLVARRQPRRDDAITLEPTETEQTILEHSSLACPRVWRRSSRP